MSKYNNAISVTFNDNDGGSAWRVHPDCVDDVIRHVRIFGLWRTRWILFKRFWGGMRYMEGLAGVDKKPDRLWVFKPEVPE